MQKNLGLHLSSVMPGIEAVTLKSRSSSDQTTFTSYSLGRARRRRLTKEEQTIADMLSSRRDLMLGARRSLTWEFYQFALDAASAPAPKIGDVIVDNVGTSWVVQKVGWQLLEQVYGCLCQAGVP